MPAVCLNVYSNIFTVILTVLFLFWCFVLLFACLAGVLSVKTWPVAKVCPVFGRICFLMFSYLFPKGGCCPVKDPHTNLLHRHTLHCLLPELLVRAAPARPLAALLFTPSHFARWQEALTPLAADALLLHVAERLTHALPQDAVIARWEHSTFAVLLPDHAPWQAELAAQACCSALEQAPLPPLFARTELPLGLCCGIAVSPPATPDRLLPMAEHRLQQQLHGSLPQLLADTDRTATMRLAERWLLHESSYLRQHAQRTAQLAQRTAQRMHLPAEVCDTLAPAALYADICLPALAGEAFYRPGPLTLAEQQRIHTHPAAAAEVTEALALPPAVTEAVLYHHERLDGSGYPRGLRGDTIPTAGLLLGLCSARAAMELPRPYRPARSRQRISAELGREADRLWPREMVQALLAC